MPSVPSPIGTIAAFAGPAVDANWENKWGWLVCDGRALSPTNPTYKALFDVIGSSWGGDAVKLFNIPDLRGLFLRGVDGTAGRDPDRNERVEIKAGGHKGNNVGSFQGGILQSHTHGASATHHINGRTFSSSTKATSEWPSGFDPGAEFADGNLSGVSRNDPTISVMINPSGGNETRPVNAAVIWIIRYK